ncbi:MAG: ParB/RepB/Spo0J family partition protein [Candidatus Aminicenantes bacterium]|nr:ParB/RepB/Spo0J family partition protein [Candidatus Aminicenantes bacterium]
MKRKVLGKGIEAIISNRSPETSEKILSDINIEDIYPNPFQPRKDFNPVKIKELANSIKEAGMIQPIVVYRKEDKYYLLVGERRWRAAQYLKWSTIPGLVKDLTIDEIMLGTLVENIQRENLNAIEIAEGIDLLMKKNDFNQESASEKLGMNRVTLTNYLRLLKLPEAIKKGIVTGDLSPGHARPLLSLNGQDDMMQAFLKILDQKLSVRQTEALVKAFYKTKSKLTRVEDPDQQKIENKLTRFFSTKVKLIYSKSGKGKIEIHFNKLDEFERIYKLIFKE